MVRDLPFRIGRGARVALSLTAEAVSSEHAELHADGDELRIRDLGSTNGTFVNGGRMLDAPLYPGDLIQLGEVALYVGRQPTEWLGSPTRKLLNGQLPLDPAMAEAMPGLLREGAVRSVFQRIVELGGESVGYEALGSGNLRSASRGSRGAVQSSVGARGGG